MLDTKVDTTPYRDAISSAEVAIANVGRTRHHSEYREECEEVLSNLYSSLEKMGTPDSVFLHIAADFVDIIMAHRPVPLAQAA